MSEACSKSDMMLEISVPVEYGVISNNIFGQKHNKVTYKYIE